TAAVTALTTSIGLIEGFDTTLFAASFIFSVIIMFDASGVRRQAGKHAELLNELVRDVQYFAREARDWGKKPITKNDKNLKNFSGINQSKFSLVLLQGLLSELFLLIYNKPRIFYLEDKW